MTDAARTDASNGDSPDGAPIVGSARQRV